MGFQTAILVVLWLALDLSNALAAESALLTGRTRNHGHYVCSTWGNSHFKTFDGDYYQFPGSCTYNFVSDCGDSYKEFSVHIHRSTDGDHPLIDKITITIKDVVILLTTNISVVNGEIATTPYYRDGIIIKKSVAYLKVFSKSGFTLMWNKEDAVMVELDPKYKNMTCGLCGDYNGISDLSSKRTNLNPIQFGNLHNIHNPQETCTDLDETLAIDTSDCSNLRSVCAELLGHAAFSGCQDLLNVEAYIIACMLDMCSCSQSQDSFCLCSTVSEFSRQCSHAGGNPGNWRTDRFCPKQCPNNMIYQESASPCKNTCSHLDSTNVCEEHNMDGCFCPEGTVLDDYTEKGCIAVSECNCVHQDFLYPPGEHIQNDCNECHCISGRWNCTDHTCPRPCSIEGGAHITTFDGKSYTFHGDCYYVLSQGIENGSHSILGEIIPCSSQETCLKSIILLTDNRQNVVTFKADGTVLLNTIKVTLPQVTASFSIIQPSESYIIVQASFGLQMQIQLQPIMQLYITMEKSTMGQLQGLCGNFNDKEIDDLQISGGLVEATASAFGNIWKSLPVCRDVSDRLDDPCSLRIENKKYADFWCAVLEKESPFTNCHSVIDPTGYAKRCRYDSCICEDSKKCMCAALSSYARACASKGIILWGWRNDICDMDISSCPSNQIYLYNLTTCQPTCRSLAEGEKACASRFTAVDGCGCQDGEFLNEKDQCVPISECSCYNDGSYLKPLQSINKQNERCICHNGKLHCIPAITDACPPGKVYYDCNNQTDVVGALNQRSCKRLDIDIFPTACLSGCVCPDGLLDDGADGCVPEESCPCSYKQDIYPSGTPINVDCNTCVCQSGRWTCTDTECYGTCSIYGSGHYITFDKNFYDFDGNCEFVAVQDYCGHNISDGSFRIITENIPCGTTGVTCSKAIKIFLGVSTQEVQYPGWDLYLCKERENFSIFCDYYNPKDECEWHYHPCGNHNIQTCRSINNVQTSVPITYLEGCYPTCPEDRPIFDESKRICVRPELCGCYVNNTQYNIGDEVPGYRSCHTCMCTTRGKIECIYNTSACFCIIDGKRYEEDEIISIQDENGVCIVLRCKKGKEEIDVCVHSTTSSTSAITTTITVPTTTVTWTSPGSTTCVYEKVCQWTQWFDVSKPEDGLDSGDYETYDVIRKNYKFCNVPEKIECRAVNDPSVQLEDLNQNVKCNVSSGLICKNSEQNLADSIWQKCYNYMIRVACCEYECVQTDTTTPVITTTTTPTASTTTMPTTSTTITPHISSTETTPIATTTTSTTEFTKTTLSTSTGTETESMTLMSLSTTPTPMTTSGSTTASCVPVCSWSQWFDVTYPPKDDDFDGGDYETYDNIRKAGYKVCERPMNISCRSKRLFNKPLEELGQNVTCDVSFGLVCNNKDQLDQSSCLNYEIKVYCCNGVEKCTTPQPSTTPQITTTAESTIPTTTELTTPTNTKSTTLTFITEPRSTTTSSVTTSGSTIHNCDPQCLWTKWFDVSSPTIYPNGGDKETYDNIRKAGFEICEKPENISCRSIRSRELPLESNGQVVTCDVSTGLTCNNIDQTRSPHICYDYEISVYCCQTYDNIRKAGYKVCERPMNISCRSKRLFNKPLEELGQNVTCDVSIGLVCNNKDQLDQSSCLNYEIKVYCCNGADKCTTPQPSTTPQITTSMAVSTIPTTTELTTPTTTKSTTVTSESTTTFITEPWSTTTSSGSTTAYLTITSKVTMPTTAIATASPSTSTAPETSTLEITTTPEVKTARILDTTTTPTPMPTTTTVTETTTPEFITTSGYTTTTITTTAITPTTTGPETSTQEITTTSEVTTPQTVVNTTTLTPMPTTTTVTGTTTPEFTTTSAITTSTNTIITTEITPMPSTTPASETSTPEFTTTSEVTTPKTIVTTTTLTPAPPTTIVTETTTPEFTSTPPMSSTSTVSETTTPGFTSTPLMSSTSTVSETTTPEYTTTPGVTTSTATYITTTSTTMPSTITESQTRSTIETEPTVVVIPSKTTTAKSQPQENPSTTSRTVPTTTSATTSLNVTTTPEITTISTTPCVCVHNGASYPPGEISSGVVNEKCYKLICSDICEIQMQSWACKSPSTTIPTFTTKTIPTSTSTTTTSQSTTTPTITTSKPYSTTKPKHTTFLTSTIPETTQKPPDCLFQPPRKYNETWKIDNCTIATCLGNTSVDIAHIRCERLPPITCANRLKPVEVRNDDGCCFHWECPCICTGWGDPHYKTFDGTYYSFQGTCTYTLVEEIKKKIINFGVYIDNYDCGTNMGVSCPHDIIVTYETHTIRISTMSLSPPVLEVLVNESIIGLPYEKSGVKVYLSQVYYVVEITSIESIIKFDGERFNINLPYHLFANNTQGQCGTCSNNRADDCLTKSGKYISDCESMANTWLVHDPKKPQCDYVKTTVPPTGSTSKTTEGTTITTTTCSPSPLCKIIMDKIFQECHKTFPPEDYYQACVYDSCHIKRSNMGCASVQQYAQLCAERGICVPWRNATLECQLPCPSNKVYNACGPVVQRTCQTTPDEDAKMKNDRHYIEGCYCPEGTLLHSKAVDTCVTSCGCVGPDNVPRKFGETFQLGCLNCVCREGGRGLICKKLECSDMQPINCDLEGFYPVTRMNSTDPCCNVTECECEPSKCTAKLPHCDLGYEVDGKIPDGHCCKKYYCVPKNVCVYGNAEYLLGATVFVDKCLNCICSNSSGTTEIQCTDVPCNEQCPPGFELKNSTRDCCRICEQTQCIISDGQKVRLLKPGEIMFSEFDNCTVYNCTLFEGKCISLVSQFPCPYFNEDNCVPGTVKLLPNGCCKTCIEINPSCKLHHKYEHLSYNNCISVNMVNVSRCEGPCNTLSIYSAAANKMSHSCTCCQEVRTSRKRVRMECSGGHQEEHEYVNVEECSCVSTNCESAQSHQPYITTQTERSVKRIKPTAAN
ncbi:mucin-2-like [Pyxicephalus adspersus]|uniref:mucin-2-like n=1 Tax=Pyxicephalus adspersus TaxID=30357 RepID=UPI003B58C0B5